MNVIAFVLLLAAAGFIAYSILSRYTSTDPTLSVPKRVWAAVVAGAAAGGAALVSWIHGITGP